MTTDIVGKTVASVEVQEWAGTDTFKDTVTWERTVITFTDGSTTAFDAWDGERNGEYRCIFDDDGKPHPLVETTRTCRHCGRAIGQDPDGRWIDPEAGWDDEFGDGIWREACDRHDTFVADHEPGDYVLHYVSDDGLPEGTWSVYRELYPDRDSDEPIDGTQIKVSTWPDETTADTEANRLQADYLKSIAYGDEAEVVVAKELGPEYGVVKLGGRWLIGTKEPRWSLVSPEPLRRSLTLAIKDVKEQA